MNATITFEPRDLWLGVFLDTPHRRMWICLLPCFPIKLTFGPRCQCGGAITLIEGKMRCSKVVERSKGILKHHEGS